MDRAEERALEAYPVKIGTFHEPDIHYEADLNLASRKKYIEGYRQAEQDNALTWEDIKRIDRILVDVRYEIKNTGSYADIPWYFGDGASEYEEALRRFNAERERNESH